MKALEFHLWRRTHIRIGDVLWSGSWTGAKLVIPRTFVHLANPHFLPIGNHDEHETDDRTQTATILVGYSILAIYLDLDEVSFSA